MEFFDEVDRLRNLGSERFIAYHRFMRWRNEEVLDMNDLACVNFFRHAAAGCSAIDDYRLCGESLNAICCFRVAGYEFNLSAISQFGFAMRNAAKGRRDKLSVSEEVQFIQACWNPNHVVS